jgi:hypothetical protein
MFLVETISIEFNQVSVPIPTNRSLKIKPKNMLFIDNNNNGIDINILDSETLFNTFLKLLGFIININNNKRILYKDVNNAAKRLNQ